ncbi:phosphomethylpyrimidine kinase [Lactococcus chungangensis CAU 28 = DSM 22330]|uniref:pyridoxal kinase n=1 Tax=Pseudolactococcus chungangensis CAU 28 = DSM 22330 TaxID=1122154 RepID=A0ABX4I760_9LACT|nr:phosphomethylpyrimidine kinase [Lactococcus chungangensis CAU 28 = DSM 22330]
MTSIVTVAENASGFEIFPTDIEIFKRQLDSLNDIAFDAIKIGLLPSIEIADLTLRFIQQHQDISVILDPVLVFKENKDEEMSLMTAKMLEFLPYVTVITPNLREAEMLAGLTITTVSDMKAAATVLSALGSRHMVIKGGSRLDKHFARDLYADGVVSREFVKPIVARNNNGAGCTFASAVASNLAHGASVLTAVKQSKEFVYQAILNSNDYGVFQLLP